MAQHQKVPAAASTKMYFRGLSVLAVKDTFVHGFAQMHKPGECLDSVHNDFDEPLSSKSVLHDGEVVLEYQSHRIPAETRKYALLRKQSVLSIL